MRIQKTTYHSFAIVAALAGAAFVGAFMFIHRAGATFPNSSQSRFDLLPVQAFVENPRSYVGNRYRIKGCLDNVLGSTGSGEGMKRLVSIAVGEGKYIPVLVPASSVSFDIQKEQSLVVYCSINGDGLPVAERIQKE